ncbi:hypothetical protein HanIR_Chr05g0220531 [Helianthus annuus]|nr:hypothetical protein HanIR_Chr05g0220531 [Helianthus annuus]
MFNPSMFLLFSYFWGSFSILSCPLIYFRISCIFLLLFSEQETNIQNELN